MSLLSPLPCPSAPAYCDIVPLFSQSIAFNRTGAHWPNWMGLWPAFHQSHSRAGCSIHRVQEGIEEVRWVVPLSPCLPSCLFLSITFLCLCFVSCYGCGNILVEINIQFPVNPFLSFHASWRIYCWRGSEKICSTLNENCLYFPRRCLLLLRHVMCICTLFKYASSFLLWKSDFERSQTTCVKFLSVL